VRTGPPHNKREKYTPNLAGFGLPGVRTASVLTVTTVLASTLGSTPTAAAAALEVRQHKVANASSTTRAAAVAPWGFMVRPITDVGDYACATVQRSWVDWFTWVAQLVRTRAWFADTAHDVILC
jgi:hypothetical protein